MGFSLRSSSEQSAVSVVPPSLPPAKPIVGTSRLSLIQALIPKEHGYPTVGLFDAMDALRAHSLKPTLLLIDESSDDTDASYDRITKKQIELINKVKQMCGRIIICCLPCQPNLKPALRAALEGSNHTCYLIEGLNKLENQEVREQIRKSDFVVVAGFDTNECVRATIGARCYFDDGRYAQALPQKGVIQAEIPVLYDDGCSHGLRPNQWEGERFIESLFFWSVPNSQCRLVEQAIQEYRHEVEAVPPGFETTMNPEKLRQLRECAFEIKGFTVRTVLEWFRDFKISPNNPLLDRITRPLS